MEARCQIILGDLHPEKNDTIRRAPPPGPWDQARVTFTSSLWPTTAKRPATRMPPKHRYATPRLMKTRRGTEVAILSIISWVATDEERDGQRQRCVPVARTTSGRHRPETDVRRPPDRAGKTDEARFEFNVSQRWAKRRCLAAIAGHVAQSRRYSRSDPYLYTKYRNRSRMREYYSICVSTALAGEIRGSPEHLCKLSTLSTDNPTTVDFYGRIGDIYLSVFDGPDIQGLRLKTLTE